MSEVSKEELAADKTGIYKQGDYIGKSGIEAYYERFLSGQRGVRVTMRNVHGMDKGSFGDGKYDTLAVPGRITGIDLDFSNMEKNFLAGKAGSIVAIEPATGEILALVSRPHRMTPISLPEKLQ